MPALPQNAAHCPTACRHRRPERTLLCRTTGLSTVRAIPTHLGEPIRPPPIAPARGPPLGPTPEAARGQPDRQAQPAPAYEFDQRIAW